MKNVLLAATLFASLHVPAAFAQSTDIGVDQHDRIAAVIVADLLKKAPPGKKPALRMNPELIKAHNKYPPGDEWPMKLFYGRLQVLLTRAAQGRVAIIVGEFPADFGLAGRLAERRGPDGRHRQVNLEAVDLKTGAIVASWEFQTTEPPR